MFLKFSPKLTILPCYGLHKMAIFATFQNVVMFGIWGIFWYVFRFLDFSQKGAIYVPKHHIINKGCKKTVPDDCGFSEKDVQLCVFGKGDNDDPFQWKNAGLAGHL